MKDHHIRPKKLKYLRFKRSVNLEELREKTFLKHRESLFSKNSNLAGVLPEFELIRNWALYFFRSYYFNIKIIMVKIF